MMILSPSIPWASVGFLMQIRIKKLCLINARTHSDLSTKRDIKRSNCNSCLILAPTTPTRMVKKYLYRDMNQVEHLQRLVTHTMADQDYKSLDIKKKTQTKHFFPMWFWWQWLVCSFNERWQKPSVLAQYWLRHGFLAVCPEDSEGQGGVQLKLTTSWSAWWKSRTLMLRRVPLQFSPRKFIF